MDLGRTIYVMEARGTFYPNRIRIQDDGCWIWIGAKHGSGYGLVRGYPVRKSYLAHRLSYEHHVGPIPPGMELDHLCETKACVNPAHLEPVTHRQNIQRHHGVFDANVHDFEQTPAQFQAIATSLVERVLP